MKKLISKYCTLPEPTNRITKVARPITNICNPAIRLPITISFQSENLPFSTPMIMLEGSPRIIQLARLETRKPYTHDIRWIDPSITFLSHTSLSLVSKVEVSKNEKIYKTTTTALFPDGLSNDMQKYKTNVAGDIWNDISEFCYRGIFYYPGHRLIDTMTITDCIEWIVLHLLFKNDQEFKDDVAFARVVFRFVPPITSPLSYINKEVKI